MSKKQTHRPALDPNAANPREPFVAVPIRGSVNSTSYRMSNVDGDIVGLDSDGCLMIWFEGEEGEEDFVGNCGETPEEFGLHNIRAEEWVLIWSKVRSVAPVAPIKEGEPCIICSEHEAKGDDDE
jgi:hypothetical protein